MWWKTFKLGVKNLLLHKLRSSLTVLGVVLGVGSVIAMLAIGEGSKREALEQIKQLGATNIIVRSIKPGNQEDQDDGTATATSQQQMSWVLDYGLTYEDLDVLKETLPIVDRAVPMSLIRKHAQHGHRLIPNARILGVTPDFREIKNLSVARGRFLTEADDEFASNVVVLGAGASDRLFSFQDPVGKSIMLGNAAFRVVGTLRNQASGNAMPGSFGREDFNRDIYVPLSSTRLRFGELQIVQTTGSRNFEKNELSEITLTIKDESLVSQSAAMIRKLLLRTHRNEEDFEVVVPLELLQRAEQEKRIWNLVLGSIAGISLLVGGIGIMNIMLASVTERTREIGIRRALGAKRRDITVQFLVETVVLSSTGGVLGIVFGLSIAFSVALFFNIETVLSTWSILLAFGISATVGIVFGIYPARRAAMMDPIDALRHE